MSIEFDNVTLGYDLHPAVHHLSLTIEDGSLLALVGPNGAGKSTLLKGIMGQLKPLGGEIRLHGIDHASIAYLPQQNQLDKAFPLTVFELVSLGAWGATGAFGSLKKQQREAVQHALLQLGLKGFEKRLIGTLSGGQMQRVLFARLLLQRADLILLDEPFTGVDSRTTADLIHQIKHWQAAGKTIVAVLHDFEQVKQHFPKTLLLSRRAIAFGDTEGVLTPENLGKAMQFNEAFDDHAEPCLMVGDHHA